MSVLAVLPAIAATTVLRNVVAGLVMIGVLVVIHEFGHFIFAKLFNIGVPVFSVGMGPRLFGVRWRGTDYRISALPIGGYVQMAGADPFGEEDAASRVDPEIDFMKKPVWQRLVVMFAGPAFNLILPFIVFTGVMMTGEPQTAPVVGGVLEGSPAERLGLQSGDRIVSANDQSIDVFVDVIRIMEDAPDKPLDLVVQRDGVERSVTVPADTVGFQFDGYVDLDSVGISPSSRSSRIGVDDPTSPAARAGLEIGDMITAVDGEEVTTWNGLMAALTPDRSHTLDFKRVVEQPGEDGETTKKPVDKTATITPDASWSPRGDEYWDNDWGMVPVMLYIGSVIKDLPAPSAGCTSGETTPTAAMSAGLQPLDRLYRLDGKPVRSWPDLTDLVAASMDGRSEGQQPNPVDVEVIRDGEKLALTLTPQIRREVVRGDVRYRPIIGVQIHPDAYVNGPQVQKYYSFTEAVPRAVEEATHILGLTVGVLGKLITFDLKPQEALGGPVEIFRAAGQGAEAGFHGFARLLATISFSLGIVNLLPVPVLDGGQIVFYSLEAIRGRPLSLELRERIQMIGVLALAALMLAVTVMDVNRWLSG